MLRGPQERTFQLDQGYLLLREQNLSHQEIADRFSVHVSTVYRRLQGIADANHTTREALLYQLKSPHSPHCDIKTPPKTVHGLELLDDLKHATTDANDLIDGIDFCLSSEIKDLRSVIQHVNELANR